MDENNVNNVNPNEEPVNEQPAQAAPEPQPAAEPQPQPGPAPQPQPGPQAAPPATDGKATASLVCGIVSFFCGGFILGIIAVVLANSYFNETGDVNNSKAKAGRICGIVSICLSVAFLIIYFIIIATAGTRYY